jgi:hypothetical protein
MHNKLSFGNGGFKSPYYEAAGWILTLLLNNLPICYCNAQLAGLHINLDACPIKDNLHNNVTVKYLDHSFSCCNIEMNYCFYASEYHEHMMCHLLNKNVLTFVKQYVLCYNFFLLHLIIMNIICQSTNCIEILLYI